MLNFQFSWFFVFFRARICIGKFPMHQTFVYHLTDWCPSSKIKEKVLSHFWTIRINVLVLGYISLFWKKQKTKNHENWKFNILILFCLQDKITTYVAYFRNLNQLTNKNTIFFWSYVFETNENPIVLFFSLFFFMLRHFVVKFLSP